MAKKEEPQRAKLPIDVPLDFVEHLNWLNNRTRALDTMQAAHDQFVFPLREEIAEKYNRFWNRMYEQFKLPINGKFSLSCTLGRWQIVEFVSPASELPKISRQSPSAPDSDA